MPHPPSCAPRQREGRIPVASPQPRAPWGPGSAADPALGSPRPGQSKMRSAHWVPEPALEAGPGSRGRRRGQRAALPVRGARAPPKGGSGARPRGHVRGAPAGRRPGAGRWAGRPRPGHAPQAPGPRRGRRQSGRGRPALPLAPAGSFIFMRRVRGGARVPRGAPPPARGSRPG